MEKPGPGAQAIRPPKLADARSHWRTAIAFNVEVKQADTRNLKAQISDLSASGFKLECYFNLDVDKPVLIRIPGLSLIPASIRWHNDTAYGCAFLDLLHPAVFDNLIARLKSGAG